MKKLILSALASIVIVISSCNQNSPAPAPAPAAPTPAPTPTTTATSSMTATETLLVGDWIWDKTEGYTSGNLSQIWTPSTYQVLPNAANTNTTYAGTHMVLKSAIHSPSPVNGFPNTYQGDFYSGTQASSGQWLVVTDQFGNSFTGNTVGIGGQGYITTLTSTNLVLEFGYNPSQIPNGTKSYYHK